MQIRPRPRHNLLSSGKGANTVKPLHVQNLNDDATGN